MANKASKWDLTTVHASLTGSTTGTDLGLGAVAQGQKRFVTYVKVVCKGPANIVQLGSAAEAATATIDSVKFDQLVNNTYETPYNPELGHPLFAIDAAGFLGAVTVQSNVSNTELTLQYYDE